MDPTTTSTIQHLVTTASTVGLRILGAIVLYLVGRALINWFIRLVQHALEKQRVDPTLLRYVGTIISVLANIALVVAILGFFGVETTSFAALLAGAGLAIGTAWGGLLSNFAAGAFLVMLSPSRWATVVSGRCHWHGASHRLFRHHHRYSRRRADPRRQRQDIQRHHPELLGQRISSCRSGGAAAHSVNDRRNARFKTKIEALPNVVETRSPTWKSCSSPISGRT